MSHINKEILDFINGIDCDEELKKFLIEILFLEYKRDKTDFKHYFKEYDKIVKVGNTDDVKATTVTNVTPTEIQVLDPDTYMTVDLNKKDTMKNINIGQEINVIKLKNKIYIIM